MTAPDFHIPEHVEQARHDHNMHCHAAHYVRSDADSNGRCGWRCEAFGVVILCWSYDVPGTGWCAHHLSQQPDIVTFPAVTVVIADASGVGE